MLVAKPVQFLLRELVIHFLIDLITGTLSGYQGVGVGGGDVELANLFFLFSVAVTFLHESATFN